MGKALEENSSPEEAELKFVAVDFVQSVLEDGARW